MKCVDRQYDRAGDQAAGAVQFRMRAVAGAGVADLGPADQALATIRSRSCEAFDSVWQMDDRANMPDQSVSDCPGPAVPAAMQDSMDAQRTADRILSMADRQTVPSPGSKQPPADAVNY
jgi:hypothetical protein